MYNIYSEIRDVKILGIECVWHVCHEIYAGILGHLPWIECKNATLVDAVTECKEAHVRIMLQHQQNPPYEISHSSY